MPPRILRPFPLATILFFVSGALGLGYELVWIRKAALVVGASQIALSTVLTSFFLGIALGSYVVGRWLRSARWSPLALYGVFEAAIGLFSLAFPWLFELLEATYGSLYPLAAGSGAALFAVRFLLLFLLCLVPTFFMGGTLPLLLDGLVEHDRAIGARTSFLYGVNILGAVAGVLATCYFAIPNLGMNGTSIAFGVGNLAIGAVALAAFGRLRPVHAEPSKGALPLFFPAAAFVSGLLAIAYQVCWARYFSLFNTGTVYRTALLLAVYLLALAVGSFVLAPLLRARFNPLRILGVVQALVPPLVLFTLEGWRLAEHRFAIHGRVVDGKVVPIDTLELDPNFAYHFRLFGEEVDAVFFAPLLQIALVIFVPVALIGVGLPSIIAAATSRSAELRANSGRIVFWNTLGSSAGGFAAGYALLPLAGLHWTLFGLGAASVALSVAALLESRRGEAQSTALTRGLLALPALGLLGAVLFAFARPDINAHTIQYHGYGRDLGYNPDGADRTSIPLREIIEGPFNASWAFENDDTLQLGSGNVCLAVVYKDAVSTQAVQGHIPVLLSPGTADPKDCLGICLGSGQSFGALLMYPIERLDVVDISREITDLSLRYCKEYNHGLESDERVRFHFDDGRHYVERADDASYDIVSMEPPPPYEDGVYSLYSEEFYREIARILRPTGVFMQWLPLYRITPLDALGIVKTQALVLPETFVVMVGLEDFMVVSYRERPVFDLARLRERCAVFATERRVKGAAWSDRCRYEMASVEGVLSLIAMGPADVATLESPLTYNDDTQLLSYSSGDRWLLRRYEGPALSPISFAALRLSNYATLRDSFAPPLSDDQIADLTRERAAALKRFNVPDPQEFGTLLQVYNTSPSAQQRAVAAIRIAQALDAVLQKDEAFRYVGEAIAALEAVPGAPDPAYEPVVRRITRNHLAAYAELVERRVAELEKRFPRSPLVKAMASELRGFRERERERLSGYLFR